MKSYLTYALVAFITVFTAASCTKNSMTPPTPPVVRTIHYTLYTNEDFSNNNGTITFSLYMRNHTNVVFDSAFAPMKIKDIPNVSNKIEIEKRVPGNDTSSLTVGFLYAIDGVGNSWHLDTCLAGQTFKVVEYAFQ